jgi:hypothetical protein
MHSVYENRSLLQNQPFVTHPKVGFAAGTKAETDETTATRHKVVFIMMKEMMGIRMVYAYIRRFIKTS